MIFEPITGISFSPPAFGASADVELGISLLERVADCTATHLQRSGYLGDKERREILELYSSHLASEPASHSTSRDFLMFLGEDRSQRHAIPRDGEVKRMQKSMRRHLYDRVHYWSLGAMQTAPHLLHERSPSSKVACDLLLCPALCPANDIVHVAALNPFAGMVAAEWIRQDGIEGMREEPFVFTIMVDISSWLPLQRRHFACDRVPEIDQV